MDTESERSDPVYRLRQLVQEKYKNEEKKEKKIIKSQQGGIFPLVPIGIAIASAVGSRLATDLYDFIKRKITGSGYKIKQHKTVKDKKLFIKDVVNNL